VNAGERRAARHYRLRGWRVIAANVRVGHDELDLIVRRGHALRFVEVRERSRTRYGTPLETIDDWKLGRLRRGSLRWLATHPELRSLDVGLDAVGVSRGRVTRVSVSFDDC